MFRIPAVNRFVTFSLIIHISVSVNEIRLSVCRILIDSDKLLVF